MQREGNKAKVGVQATCHRWRHGLCVRPAVAKIALTIKLLVAKAKAGGKKVSRSRKAHDKRCYLNRKTKGLSATTVFVEREATRNVARCTAPLASVLGRTLAAEAAEAGANIGRFFHPCPQLNPPVPNVAQLPLRTDDVVACRDQQGPIPKNFEQKIEVFAKFSTIL